MNIPPGTLTQLTARSQLDEFFPERLLIKEADHWRIDEIRAEGRSGALARDLSGEVFAPESIGRFPGCGELSLPSGGELIVRATYRGPLKAGAPFEACIFGSDGQPLSPIASTTRNSAKGAMLTTARSDGLVYPDKTVKLSTDPFSRDSWLGRVAIKNASDWIVNDVLLGEVSIFAQSGDVPGSMFSEIVETSACLGRLAAGDAFSIVATYAGTGAGSALSYDLYGASVESDTSALPVVSILPWSSGLSVPPNRAVQVTARCNGSEARRSLGDGARLVDVACRSVGSGQGFLAERIVVENAVDWVIGDIKIGRSSQFAQSGEVPGAAFGPGAIGSVVSFDVARPRVDVSAVATYCGRVESGSAFLCGIFGSVVDLT